MAAGDARPRVGAHGRLRRVPPALRLRRRARPSSCDRLTRVLRGRGKPFVLTVHDLRNPHHDDRAAPRRAARRAGAGSRRGRDPDSRAPRARSRHAGVGTATVVPHPHVVDLPTISRALEVRPRWRRPPVPRGPAPQEPARQHGPDADPADARGDRGGPRRRGAAGQLPPRHPRRRRRPTGRGARGLAAREAAAGRLELEVHDYLSDEDLWGYLASLDLSVLPYTFGTHSGWLEACRDLQTTVLAPSCGYYADQGPILSYTNDGDDFDADSLRDAVVRRAPSDRASARRRRAHRAASPGRAGPRGPVSRGEQVTCASRGPAADLPGRQLPLPDRGALHRRARVDDLAPRQRARPPWARGLGLRRPGLRPGPRRGRAGGRRRCRTARVATTSTHRPTSRWRSTTPTCR